jgi:hypothetical protein
MKVHKTSRSAEKNWRSILTKFSTRRKCSKAMPSDTSSNNRRSRPKETKSWKLCERRKTINLDHLFYLALYILHREIIEKIAKNYTDTTFLELLIEE